MAVNFEPEYRVRIHHPQPFTPGSAISLTEMERRGPYITHNLRVKFIDDVTGVTSTLTSSTTTNQA